MATGPRGRARWRKESVSAIFGTGSMGGVEYGRSLTRRLLENLVESGSFVPPSGLWKLL